ncbi:MAG: hypothetical protein RMM53_02435 [Bacteroidia bacterium]|nr:hypothetical protein [Bacteroidia bacterium]MDW8333053.1 hypothetical protein [Bacteroidia bacterium]
MPGLILQAANHLLFRSEKIYAVLAVVLIVWGGVMVYLWRLDRKISRWEKDEQS